MFPLPRRLTRTSRPPREGIVNDGEGEQTADIKVLGSLGRDDLRKLCGDNFPEWISFPQFEQVRRTPATKMSVPLRTGPFRCGHVWVHRV